MATKSPQDTASMGAALAELAQPGDLILLAGDLGSGKTVFAQGFARGLGVRERVTSPTFVLARTYEGRLRLHHLDVYRLDHLQEVIDLDVAEMVDDEAVVLVEWGDVAAPALPPDLLEARLTFGSGEDDRVVSLRPVGTSWRPRQGALEARFDEWRGPGLRW